MELIISHQRADFDGLAAMVAVQKLHPEAVMAFSGKTANNVDRFMSLYKDRITVKTPREIDQSRVQKLILVDTHHPARLGPFAELAEKEEVEVVVYDHHQDKEETPLFTTREVIQEVGATTTILVDKLQQSGGKITSFEATLFVLGIYEDTGGLIYKSTTAQDLQMAAYLLEQGANLEIVDEYMDYSLTRKQQRLFNKLRDSLHQISVKGLKIDTFQAEAEEYIPDVSLLAHKLNDLHNCDALFVIVRFGQDKVLLIGRSNSDNINVAEILNYFGGGGHSRAASATCSCDEEACALLQWEQEVLKVAREKVTASVLVKDVMSSPVKTVTPDTTMREADEIMLRNGWSGLVVMEEGEIKGVISKKDIDKVRNYDLMHAPVKGYMSTDVITISPEASLKEVQDEIVEHDIGRLPVLDREGNLVGIITRGDLLKLFYGTDDYLKNRQNLYGRSLVQVQEKRYDITDKLELVDDWIVNLLTEAGKLAAELEFDLYIVGGFVRDLLLDKVNLDLDLVVEGDGIEFARKLAQEFNGASDIYHEFGTAVVYLDDIKLDVATTRVEYYPHTASLPEVEAGSIQQDLFRRDFTINALAIQLNGDYFGQLVDYFQGKEDLEAGIIRLLHNFSLYDDPTRIFRGFRFASRYGYRFDERTKELVQQAVDLDIIEKLSDDRLFNKLKYGLQDEYPELFLQLLAEYNILSYFSEQIVWDQLTEELVNQVQKVLKWVTDLEITVDFTEWILYLMALVFNLSPTEIEGFADRFSLSKGLTSHLLQTEEIDRIINKLKETEQNSEIYFLVDDLALEELLFILVKDFSLQTKIKVYLEELQWINLEITGNDLIELGYEPGPYFKETLKAVKKARLDGRVVSYQEELEFAKNYLD